MKKFLENCLIGFCSLYAGVILLGILIDIRKMMLPPLLPWQADHSVTEAVLFEPKYSLNCLLGGFLIGCAVQVVILLASTNQRLSKPE